MGQQKRGKSEINFKIACALCLADKLTVNKYKISNSMWTFGAIKSWNIVIW